ncbi:MAG: sodium/solute symporter [Candidatus Hydrogenedentes bacterium]|nr:sodium/solute symporter [Candidatus Hydrogenedentota bacterium]
MGRLGRVDLLEIVLYFAVLILIGWYFSRRSGTTEQYFLAGRNYPGWLVGISLFGATISSITFIAYPADAFKTGYLRYVICITLPIAVFIASRFFVPFFRRGKITSVFEYLEGRFGPGTRVYGASVFILAQCIRLAMILYLTAILMQAVTGWDARWCILLGSVVTAYYTVAGGMKAVIWTDFVQSVILTLGGLVILAAIVMKLPGGLGQIFSVAAEQGRFGLNEMGADGTLHAVPKGISLSHKTVAMLLIVGLFQWLAEYSTNQENIQKYCTSKTARDARRAMWICCWCCVPTWAYFMFLGTGLYVFYQQFPDPAALEMQTGVRKAEEILPYFIATQLPTGITGLVVAAVLAAAMSSLSSAMNSIAAVAITDIYRRHWVKDRSDTHYVAAARWVTFFSAAIMVIGALWLYYSDQLTLQDLWTELQSIVAGGVLGLYMFGFFTTRGDGRAVAAGIALAVAFSAIMSFSGLGWLPQGMTQFIGAWFDGYYTGLVGNVVMFGMGFLAAGLLPKRERDLTNLTIWTQSDTPLD